MNVPEVMNMPEVQMPSPWVTRWAIARLRRASSAQNAAPLRALDLACGQGRHARWLTAQGVQVTAVDRDVDALQGLLEVTGVSIVRADLEGGPWPLVGAKFDLVIVTNYLHRALFSTLADAVAPNGVLIYETFMRGNERFGRPANPAFLLAPGELLNSFGAGLTIAGFEQGERHSPKPAMVQRVALWHGPAESVLLG